MPDLTPAEAQKLFNQTSKALRENDSEKLAEIMETQPDDDQVTTEPTTPAEEPEKKDDSIEEVQAKEEPEKDEPEATPPAKAEEPEKKEEPEEPSEVDKLREQLRKSEEKIHALKSQAGRVPHIQGKLKEYDKKLDELEKKLTSPSSQPSTEIQTKLQQLLKGVEGADPELAKAIADAILAATEGVTKESVAKEKENLQFLRDQEVRSYQAMEADRLLEMYPNAPQVFASDDWKKWKSEQSAGIRRLAEGDVAEDVAYAFEKYAKDMLAKYPELAKVDDKATSEKSPPVADEAAERAKNVEAERQRKKATAVTVANPTASGKVDMPDNPQALFDKFAEQIRKERTG
jgi:hypothetical protein